MKKIDKKHNVRFALLIFCAFLVSCKESFLEVVPPGRLVATTVDDYSAMLNSLDVVNVINPTAQIPMGDDVSAIEPYFSGSALKTQRLFRWEPVIYEPDEDASELRTPLQNIYIFNSVINGVPNASVGSDAQKAVVIAEAKAMRAWVYFLLINYYGKPYNPETASTDLGLPIVTEADVTETNFTRASVQEVYDFILADLTAAIPDLPTTVNNRLRMSRSAAEGILGKVYMYMRNFQEALPLLDACLTNISGVGVPVELYDYNVTFAPGGAFLPISILGPTYPTIVNNTENAFTRNGGNPWAFVFQFELVLSQEAQNLYDASDLRLNFFTPTIYGGPDYANGLVKRSAPSTMSIGVNLPEIYLLRAECRARLNDLAGARMDVEALRTKRMPEENVAIPDAVANVQEDLLRYIMEERTREFAYMGFRWFDMRRLSVDPLFSNDVYRHILYAESGDVISTYELTLDRLTLRMPPKVLSENPDMPDNP